MGSTVECGDSSAEIGVEDEYSRNGVFGISLFLWLSFHAPTELHLSSIAVPCCLVFASFHVFEFLSCLDVRILYETPPRRTRGALIFTIFPVDHECKRTGSPRRYRPSNPFRGYRDDNSLSLSLNIGVHQGRRRGHIEDHTPLNVRYERWAGAVTAHGYSSSQTRFERQTTIGQHRYGIVFDPAACLPST